MWKHIRHNHLWDAILPTLTHDDLAHDWLHVQRVTEWCSKIAMSIGADEDLAGVQVCFTTSSTPKESDLRLWAVHLYTGWYNI